jgi:methylglutaconyl-CoA hydratase
MMKAGMLGYTENFQEALQLAELFSLVYHFPVPVIAVAQGTVAGGANGLIAASDIAIAGKDCTFRFSEVKLGLVPATISPYVVERTGIAVASELMLTARPIAAMEAEKTGLINRVAESSELESLVDETIRLILSNGPEALRETKALLRALSTREKDDNLDRFTASIIAKARASKEAYEGLSAFLTKRKPSWHVPQ